MNSLRFNFPMANTINPIYVVFNLVTRLNIPLSLWRGCGLGIFVDEVDGSFGEGVSDEEVAFSVAEPVVAMAYVGRLHAVSGKVVSDNEGGIFYLFSTTFLGLAEGGHVAFGLGAAVTKFADNDGEVRGFEFGADIFGEVDEIGVVFGDGWRVTHVIPALHPNEGGNFDVAAGEVGEGLGNVGNVFANVGEHLGVELAGIAARAGRSEVFE